MLDKYKSGNKDPEFFRTVAYAASDAYDPEVAKEAANNYLSTQTNLTTKENIDFIQRFTMSTSDKGFDILVANEKKMGEAASEKIVHLLKQDYMFPSLRKQDAQEPDWSALSATLSKKYPKHYKQVIYGGKTDYYQSKQSWAKFAPAAMQYVKEFGNKLSPDDLNNYAWQIFDHCKDMACVAEAVKWSKRSIDAKPDPNFMDTYANLLHKAGRTKEAIEIEEKAMGMVEGDEKKSYQLNIDKMKKGEKTWNE
jgi:hypothetical protein